MQRKCLSQPNILIWDLMYVQKTELSEEIQSAIEKACSLSSQAAEA